MGWEPWEEYRRAPLIRGNGIRATTQRGQFGKSWWASRWIAALERLVNEGRLSRGRSYARNGQVVELSVGVSGISARVQGSRPTPYRVSIRFRRLSDAEWEKVADAMAQKAIFAAKLLSGEMPAEIEDVFTAAGASLLPAARGDLTSDCSCPDAANPCKHVAAVHYLLGERFESEPFLMFELRGRTQADVTAMLRARRAGGSVAEDASMEVVDEPEAPSLATLLDSFWTVPNDAAPPPIVFESAAMTAAAVKRLGPPPFVTGSADFAGVMEDVYRAVAEHAFQLAMGDE